MNPTGRIWDLPPPPGTEDEDVSCNSLKILDEVSDNSTTTKKDDHFTRQLKDIEDSFVKNKQDKSKYVSKDKDGIIATRLESSSRNLERSEHRRRYSCERGRYRSRTRSRDKRRKRHSRSRSRDRHRRSHSRSRRRRRRYSSSRSSSRSRSRSAGYFRPYRRRKHGKRRRSISRSRSRSSSHRKHSRSYKSKSGDKRSGSPKAHIKDENIDTDINEIDMKIDEEDDDDPQKDNVFKNDGSFLEMFKKMQEQQQKAQESTEQEKKPVLPTFGKRRGGKVLKTGLVQKPRPLNEEESAAQDAWSIYMKEVRKYKEACCDDDSKTRPLVK